MQGVVAWQGHHRYEILQRAIVAKELTANLVHCPAELRQSTLLAAFTYRPPATVFGLLGIYTRFSLFLGIHDATLDGGI